MQQLAVDAVEIQVENLVRSEPANLERLVPVRRRLSGQDPGLIDDRHASDLVPVGVGEATVRTANRGQQPSKTDRYPRLLFCLSHGGILWGLVNFDTPADRRPTPRVGVAHQEYPTLSVHGQHSHRREKQEIPADPFSDSSNVGRDGHTRA